MKKIVLLLLCTSLSIISLKGMTDATMHDNPQTSERNLARIGDQLRELENELLSRPGHGADIIDRINQRNAELLNVKVHLQPNLRLERKVGAYQYKMESMTYTVIENLYHWSNQLYNGLERFYGSTADEQREFIHKLGIYNEILNALNDSPFPLQPEEQRKVNQIQAQIMTMREALLLN